MSCWVIELSGYWMSVSEVEACLPMRWPMLLQGGLLVGYDKLMLHPEVW